MACSTLARNAVTFVNVRTAPAVSPGRRIGSRAKQEAPVATPDVTAAWRVIRDDLPTELLNILDVPQSGDGIEAPAYVG